MISVIEVRVYSIGLVEGWGEKKLSEIDFPASEQKYLYLVAKEIRRLYPNIRVIDVQTTATGEHADRIDVRGLPKDENGAYPLTIDKMQEEIGAAMGDIYNQQDWVVMRNQ